MAATFTFGRFTPPIPFSASDQQKIDASITQTTIIKLEDYPVGYEMVKARVDWTGSALDIDRVVEFRWYNEDTNELLFTWQGTFLAGWVWAWMESWIGHKDSGEIDRPGNYIVQIFSPGLFSKEIRFTVTAELPPEPEPEYPKTISRGPYSFTANNSNEETQIKEFLGIEPAGDDLDVWLSKKDTAGIQQWLNYWGNIWEDLGRGDLFSFTTAKAKEYFDKLEEEESGIFIELFKTNFAGALTLLPNLSQFVINTALESLIRNFESRVEDFADYLADRFLADYPEYSILRGEKKGSLTLLGIFMIVGSIIGFGTLVNWLRKELPEPAGMAVWAAIEAEDWETANEANKRYKTFIRVANTWIISTMGWLNPFIKSYFDKNRDAQLASADTYQKLIDAELAVKTGLLVIRPIPPDAKVSVAGEIPTTGTFSKELTPGSYDWIVSKYISHSPKSGTIEVTEAGADFTVELEPLPEEPSEEDKWEEIRKEQELWQEEQLRKKAEYYANLQAELEIQKAKDLQAAQEYWDQVEEEKKETAAERLREQELYWDNVLAEREIAKEEERLADEAYWAVLEENRKLAAEEKRLTEEEYWEQLYEAERLREEEKRLADAAYWDAIYAQQEARKQETGYVPTTWSPTPSVREKTYAPLYPTLEPPQYQNLHS